MKRSLAILLIGVLAVLCLAGCETLQGGGKDPTGEGADSTAASLAAEPPATTELPATTLPVGELSRDIVAVFRSGVYHLQFRLDSDYGEVLTDLYVKGDDICTKLKVLGVTNRRVRKGSTVYHIVDMTRTITKTEADASSGTNAPYTPDMVLVGSGEMVFDGSKLSYDHYHSPSGETYFFVKNGLKGIRTVRNGVTSDMRVDVLDSVIPGDVFDIPLDYTVK